MAARARRLSQRSPTVADLLDLLGDEWKVIAPVSCTAEDRLSATHGCRACGRAPSTWSEAYGCYLDGMGRPTRCGYCNSCVPET